MLNNIHYQVPLSATKEDESAALKTDLTPGYLNCHAILHRKNRYLPHAWT